MRTNFKIAIKSSPLLKQKLLHWAQQFDSVVWLDTNNYKPFLTYHAILAVDAFTSIKTDYFEAFKKLDEYQSYTNDWIFGYLTYDLKNDVEHLRSENFDGLQFSDLYFFQPKRIFFITKEAIELHYLNVVKDEMESDLKAIFETEIPELKNFEKLNILPRISKLEYVNKVEKIMQHIKRGDIYEANFCQEFYVESATINPVQVFQKLNTISQPPMATFLKCFNKYVLSASPERYLQKQGNTVISQPIKGTAKRSEDKTIDAQLKVNLASNEKERSENIMIVDLVRNDLSKTAIKGSVKVNELCKVYTFQQVHQLVSTISAKVDTKTSPIEILKTTFPMGSMTGAPKLSAMQIIEDLESTKRGLYSGAVGYISPKKDFDFNVVIRSILYNETSKYISFSVGSAITAKSIAEQEYQECLLKAKALRQVLEY